MNREFEVHARQWAIDRVLASWAHPIDEFGIKRAARIVATPNDAAAVIAAAAPLAAWVLFETRKASGSEHESLMQPVPVEGGSGPCGIGKLSLGSREQQNDRVGDGLAAFAGGAGHEQVSVAGLNDSNVTQGPGSATGPGPESQALTIERPKIDAP